jgi:hypothetical protein
VRDVALAGNTDRRKLHFQGPPGPSIPLPAPVVTQPPVGTPPVASSRTMHTADSYRSVSFLGRTRARLRRFPWKLVTVTAASLLVISIIAFVWWRQVHKPTPITEPFESRVAIPATPAVLPPPAEPPRRKRKRTAKPTTGSDDLYWPLADAGSRTEHSSHGGRTDAGSGGILWEAMQEPRGDRP